MKLLKFFSLKLLLIIFTLSLVGFVILSWWLLFRDQRAIQGFEAVYTDFGGVLFFIRAVLLHYSLNVVPTVLFVICSVCACISYFGLLKREIALKHVIALTILFQSIVFLSYPILSTDIFSYIFSDRVASEYHNNKWLVVPQEFSEDIFEQFADWKDKTNAYGYVNHLVYLPAVYLGRSSVFLTVLLYKLTAAIFVLGSFFVLRTLLQEYPVSQRNFYFKLLFWNPLFLLEMLGSAHNDSVMIFFLLLAVLFWQRKKLFLAGTFLACSVQVKLLPLIYFGFLALSLLQNVDKKKSKLHPFILFVFPFLAVNSLSFLLMNVSPFSFLQRALYNTTSYWQSIPGLVERFIPNVTVPFSMLFIVTCLVLACIQCMQKVNPFFSSGLAFLLFFVFFTGAYWNWYVLWVLAVVPFFQSSDKNNIIRNTILFLTVTSLLAYPLLWLSHRFWFGHPLWSVLMYLWIFGVPIGFLGYNYKKEIKG